MSQTDSGETGTSSHDTSETSVEDEDATVGLVPTLARLCTALVLKTMHQMVLDTAIANLNEEAEVGIVNFSLMRLTCADLRKAFNKKVNIDQELQGKSDYAVQSVLYKTILAHGSAYHTVDSTEAVVGGRELKCVHFLGPNQSIPMKAIINNREDAAPLSVGVDKLRKTITCHNFAVPSVFQVACTAYQNELLVLWGLYKSSKDSLWLAHQCEDALMKSLSGDVESRDLLPYALPVTLAALTAPGRVSRPAGLQAGDLTSCNYARLAHNIQPVVFPTALDLQLFAVAASRPCSPCPSPSSSSPAESAQAAHSSQGTSNNQAASSPSASSPQGVQADACRGHMSLEWTLGQQSGVGGTLVVHAKWLQPDGAIAAVLTRQPIQCNASKLISLEVLAKKKTCSALLQLSSLERVHPSIASPDLVRQVVSTTQMARLHRILRSLRKCMSVTATNLVLSDQGQTTELVLATADYVWGIPEWRELLQRVEDTADCLYILQLSKRAA